MPRTRVAVLFERFGPYHVARLRACTAHLDTIGVEFFGADATYAWAPTGAIPGVRRVTVLPSQTHDVPALIRGVQSALDSLAPEVVAVPGWSHAGALSAVKWCVDASVPFILMGDSFTGAANLRLLRQWFKRRVVKMAGAALVAGTRHRAYLCEMGMPGDRVFSGYDVVDNGHFRGEPATTHDEGDAGRYFLTVARMIPEKNLTVLLEAYADYVRGCLAESLDLVIVGDGRERVHLESLARSLGIDHRVRFLGFRQYEDLPSIYRGARAFVLPSVSETWGLAVNEAMASGVPVLVSENCGCAPDLVSAGVNGFTFRPEDRARLASLLTQLAQNESQAVTMGKHGRSMIERWSPDLFARRMLSAAESSLQSPRPRHGFFDRIGVDALLTALRATGRMQA